MQQKGASITIIMKPAVICHTPAIRHIGEIVMQFHAPKNIDAEICHSLLSWCKLFVGDTWGCENCSSFAEILHPPGDAVSGLWVGSPGPGEECAPHLVHGFARSLGLFGHPQLTGKMYLLHTTVQAQCLILVHNHVKNELWVQFSRVLGVDPTLDVNPLSCH